jgi:hypothetical protein
MSPKSAMALLPLLVACAVSAGCSSGGGPLPQGSQALRCGLVVDPDAISYLGGPLTAGRAIALLTGLQRSGGAARISTGRLSAADRSTLDIVAVELTGYSGSKLSDDATAFARAELMYSPDYLPLDTSYARSLERDIAA